MAIDCKLVADIGATNTRVALVENIKVAKESIRRYENQAASSVYEIISNYMLQMSTKSVGSVCLAIAGPVVKNRAEMTNLSWKIEKDVLTEITGAKNVKLLNDLQAQALALETLEGKNIRNLWGPTKPKDNQLKLVSNIGTGFNISLAIPTETNTIVPPAEAGHTNLPTRNDLEVEISNFIRSHKGFASIEHILSGNGLVILNKFFNPKLKKTSVQIIEDGKRNKQYANQVIDTFVTFMGSVLGDLTLTLLPYGGIFLVGSVSRAIAPFIKETTFGKAFCDKGQFSEFARQFSVNLVLDDLAALNGCTNFLVSLKPELLSI